MRINVRELVMLVFSLDQVKSVLSCMYELPSFVVTNRNEKYL